MITKEQFGKILAEAKMQTADVLFLKDCKIKSENDKITIYLAHGGKNYLEESTNFVNLLKKIIAREFGFNAEIILEGIVSLHKNDAKDKINTSEHIKKIEKELIDGQKEQKAAEKIEKETKKRELQQQKTEKINSKTNTLIDSTPLTKSINPEAEKNTVVYEKNSDILTAGYLKTKFSKKKHIFSKSGSEEEIEASEILPIGAIDENSSGFFVCGKIFSIETRDIKRSNKKIASIKITDYCSSITVKLTDSTDSVSQLLKNIEENDCVIISGEAEYDDYDEEIIVKLDSLAKTEEYANIDFAEKKRVELHLHTTMSNMDATIKPEEIISHAYKIGHKAVALTDHGNVQGFPEAMLASEKLKLKEGESFKILYGIEGYLLDDTGNFIVGKANAKFNEDTFVIFDIETTGLSPNKCGITEIGAVKVKEGEIIEEFSTFVNPQMPIPQETVKLNGITDETVKNAPKTKEALKKFFDFAGDFMLVAHNANFDIGFIKKYASVCKYDFTNPYLDTLAMSRNINKDLKRHSLDALVEFYKIEDFQHHRACDDARALALIFINMVEQMKSFGVLTVFEMNEMSSSAEKQTYHIILLAQNKTGLKNLFKIISESYLDYFYKKARIPKSVLEQFREGIIVGSACESGELFSAVAENKNDEELKEIAKFYDYLEIQPIGNNMFLVNNGTVPNEEALKKLNMKIVELGEKTNKPVVATGDVHFLEKHDEISRKILLSGMKFSDADRHIPLYYRTTEEMLDEFSYLPKEKAFEIVVENTNKIADMIEDVRPIPKGSYTPKMEGAEDRLKEICYSKAFEIYKNPLPEIVENRLDRELSAIIQNGFAVLYVIAVDLVTNSEKKGYLVASRGSVGSSFVATLAGITEVNPLPPHYYCKNKNCAYSEFVTDGSYGSGYDLPEKNCPKCENKLSKEGQDIPFETFLGFNGEKAPDIDLNFSGEVQSAAHKYTEELFGKENVFRAGTIGALADKTAYGFVMKYLEDKKINLNKAHTDWLVSKCVGVKRTTGQHPGGIIVVPREHEIYDFTPVQHPADDVKSGVVTTHFPFEFLHDTILKLDLLGHDVPTKYKILKDMTGIDVRDLPTNDKNVMELFVSTKSIGVNPKDICNELGTFGIPEMGTKFVRQMIMETKPGSFADLLQISGLSHGTGVWVGNARDLIKNEICKLPEVIGLRDDIMLYLMHKNLDPGIAFLITENVRKGKGLTRDWEQIMRENDVPEWYIDSCKKIKYMFPKAHASAYIIAAMRLGWFKVYKPLEFYASYFTVQPEGFDAELALSDVGNIKSYVEEIEKKGIEAKQKENEVMTTMQLVLEMYARNLKFLPVDIYKSESFEYKIENGKIRLPFSSISGVGETAAENLAAARESSKGEIFSIEEIGKKAKLTKNVVEILKRNNVFGDIPETDQISLF
ncbi:MAG: PolC-type DNA polymerase III [Oscillospiraceae bacterium]|nr:PolC-type DNA polymerase III [Oscillospiraceae bacterium]